MSKYQLDLIGEKVKDMSTYRISVTVKDTDIKRVVDVNASPNSISNLSDVNTIDRQNNYLLVWNEATQLHQYIPASQVTDVSDDVLDDTLDYGTY